MNLPPDRNTKRIIFGLLFLLANQLQTIGDNFFEEITTKQWFILIVLTLFPDRAPTLNELSEAAGSSHQNVKQIILKLESKGFVELTKDEKDARKFRIRVTPRCEQFFEQNHERSDLFMTQLFNQLGETELNTTAKVLNKLQENLEEMGNEYAGSEEK